LNDWIIWGSSRGSAVRLAEYLDARDEHLHERVSVGTATVAMILNGLGFANRRLDLVPQFFATKPVEHLLGAEIHAEDLNDECLGHALDWLYAHDPTVLFAGIAAQARRRFGMGARHLHVDTTSFSVSGAYTLEEGEVDAEVGAEAIAITYGLLARPSAGPEAVDAGAGHHRGGDPGLLASARWQRQ
jgi:transposase